eukprot:164866_1
MEYWSCGHNENGSHGNGSKENIETLTKMKYIPHTFEIDMIVSGGNGSTYIVSKDNKLIVCGYASVGQLGVHCINNGFTNLLIQFIPLIVSWWYRPNFFPPELISLIFHFAQQIEYVSDQSTKWRNYGTTLSPILYPIIATNFDIKYISQGIESHHAFIITQQNEIYASGDNNWCKITNKSSQRMKHNHWTKWMSTEFNIKQVCTSHSYTIFLSDTGELYSRGMSYRGALGLGTDKRSCSTNEKINIGQATVKAIACGLNHNLALTEEGKVFFWGRMNSMGSHNEKTVWGKETEWIPKYIKYFNELNVEIVKIQCGSLHCLCLDNNGKIYTW